MICDKCKLLFAPKFDLAAPVDHAGMTNSVFRDARDLKIAADECPLCRFLLQFLPGFDEEHDSVTRRKWVFPRGWKTGFSSKSDSIHYSLAVGQAILRGIN